MDYSLQMQGSCSHRPSSHRYAKNADELYTGPSWVAGNVHLQEGAAGLPSTQDRKRAKATAARFVSRCWRPGPPQSKEPEMIINGFQTGANFIFCIPNMNKCILLVSVIRSPSVPETRSRRRHLLVDGKSGDQHGPIYLAKMLKRQLRNAKFVVPCYWHGVSVTVSVSLTRC
jgi:hypothetical protein